MSYNDIAMNLLDDDESNYIYCYVSNGSYEMALFESTVTLIHSYDSESKYFVDIHEDIWRYVVPLAITPIELPN